MRISQAQWHRIRQDWLSSLDTPKVIAARHGIGHRAVLNRASKHGWPERGSMADDPATIARLLYADLSAELRASLRALRDDGALESPATATQRAPLIRAHRRALIALLDARKPLASGATDSVAPRDEVFPALDLEAAHKDILDRLARLEAAKS